MADSGELGGGLVGWSGSGIAREALAWLVAAGGVAQGVVEGRRGGSIGREEGGGCRYRRERGRGKR